MVVRLVEGEFVEAAMVGRDTVYGAGAALDGNVALNEAIVQMAGTASVLDIAQLRAAAMQSEPFRAILVRHEQALLAQALQSAACIASHTLEARLSRWLLRARDLSGDRLALTQEFLAQMLGAQRSSVSVVANTLQRAGLIRYVRGHIEILNLAGLTEVLVNATELSRRIMTSCASRIDGGAYLKIHAARGVISSRDLRAERALRRDLLTALA